MENIDINFAAPSPHHPMHNRHQVLQKYTTALRQLRALAEQSYRVRPYYFDNYVYFQYFQQRSNLDDTAAVDVAYSPPLAFLKMELFKHILNRRRQILYWVFYLLVAFLCVFVYRYEATSIADRHIQSFVYPGMRLWRRLTMPVIERFPRLTELYDESCLMENPFFQADGLSCEPCAGAQSVVDLTQKEGISMYSNSGGSQAKEKPEGDLRETPLQFVPFIFKINQTPTNLDDFYDIYSNNHEIFQRDAYRVQSTNNDITNLEELFHQFNISQLDSHHHQPQAHNLWRCNRMLPARLLRRLIARPSRLPNTGVALERFVAIDTPQAPAYTLPDTECANVYVQQTLGTRYIILRPTSECRHKCRTLSVRLPQSFVLSYNWWYWKPISAPDPVSDSVSISLIGSYC